MTLERRLGTGSIFVRFFIDNAAYCGRFHSAFVKTGELLWRDSQLISGDDDLIQQRGFQDAEAFPSSGGDGDG